jgi:Zn-dependent protease
VTMTRARRTAPPGPGSDPGRAGLRIAGITVRLTTGAYLLAMVVVLVSALTLPDAAPGWPVFAYLAATAGLVVAFLGSLVAHEIAHAVVARRYGVGTGEIRIGLSGSAGHGRHEFASPRAAWRAAAAGPAASLAVIAVTVGATLGLAAAGAGQLTVTAFAALTWINVVLTVINALPGAGLDGGRVVHALAWARSGDRARAAVTAGRIGQFTGALLIGTGIVMLALGYLAGILAGLVGLMVASTSRAQVREVLATTALAGLRVRDILRPADPAGMAPVWQTVQAFLDREFAGAQEPGAQEPGAQEQGMGHGLGDGAAVAFPLRDFHGGAGGVVTLTQLAAVPPAQRASIRLADIATPAADLVTTTPDEQLSRLLTRLAVAPRTPAALHTSGHALVLDDQGQPAGVLTPADFSRASQLGGLHPRGRRPPP